MACLLSALSLTLLHVSLTSLQCGQFNTPCVSSLLPPLSLPIRQQIREAQDTMTRLLSEASIVFLTFTHTKDAPLCKQKQRDEQVTTSEVIQRLNIVGLIKVLVKLI